MAKLQGTHTRVPRAASGSIAGSTMDPAKVVVTPGGEEFVMAERMKTTTDSNKDIRKMEMYNKHIVEAVFEPGPRAKYEATRMKEQMKCNHPNDELRWGANETTTFASCKTCGLKSVVLYHRVSGDTAEQDENDMARFQPETGYGSAFAPSQVQPGAGGAGNLCRLRPS